jgi:hypothetical protein
LVTIIKIGISYLKLIKFFADICGMFFFNLYVWAWLKSTFANCRVSLISDHWRESRGGEGQFVVMHRMCPLGVIIENSMIVSNTHQNSKSVHLVLSKWYEKSSCIWFHLEDFFWKMWKIIMLSTYIKNYFVEGSEILLTLHKVLI